jgi:hypothetical protein
MVPTLQVLEMHKTNPFEKKDEKKGRKINARVRIPHRSSECVGDDGDFFCFDEVVEKGVVKGLWGLYGFLLSYSLFLLTCVENVFNG